jgi:hypothetical protein
MDQADLELAALAFLCEDSCDETLVLELALGTENPWKPNSPTSPAGSTDPAATA